jgi:hypothetical protein
LRHFLDWVSSGEQLDSTPTFRDGYINSLLIDSIVESSQSERWVRIEPKQ